MFCIETKVAETVYEYSRAWNEYWADHYQNYEGQIDVFYYSDRLLDDEVTRTVSADIPVFGAALVLMLIYLMFTLGKRSCIGARPWLALSAVIILLGAIIVGFSTSLCLGFTFNSFVMLVPFLLLGVGVDDMS